MDFSPSFLAETERMRRLSKWRTSGGLTDGSSGPERWASGPTTRQGAPRNARKPRSENMALALQHRAEGWTLHHELHQAHPSLWSLSSTPAGVTLELHPEQGKDECVTLRTISTSADTSQGESLPLPRWEPCQVQTHKLLPRIPQNYPGWEDGRSMVNNDTATFLALVLSNTTDLTLLVARGGLSSEVSIFLKLKHREDLCSRTGRRSYF